MPNTSSGSSIPVFVEPAAPVGVEHLDVRQREVEGGERGQALPSIPFKPSGNAIRSILPRTF
jgi:hypothetical protein